MWPGARSLRRAAAGEAGAANVPEEPVVGDTLAPDFDPRRSLGSIQNLAAALDEETRVARALVAVLRREQRAMVGLAPQAIFACLEERRTLEAELRRLAGSRRTLVDGFATGAEPATLATILRTQLPPPVRERVAAGLHALRGELAEARSLERQNARLARESLASVAELLRALRGLVPGARYDAEARVDVPAGRESVDRRV
jgi:hypothetical protein